MRELVARMVSRLLWEAGAVKISLEQPLRVASGRLSPLYIDCRLLISSPTAMDLVTSCMHWVTDDERVEADCVAGGETAGIPFAAQLAARLCRPMVYVRKQAKEYGTRSAVEGGEVAGRRVVLVEDLVTDGASKLKFVCGLREAGAVVEDCLVVLDRQQGGGGLLAASGVRLHALTSLNVTLDEGKAVGAVSAEAVAGIEQYLKERE